MIWVFEDGPFFDGSRRFTEQSRVEYVFVGLDFNLAECSSIDLMVDKYKQSVNRTLIPWESDIVLPQAWRFSHEIELGDYAVVSCNHSALVGKIAGAYSIDQDQSGKTRHYYKIISRGVLPASHGLPPSLKALTHGLRGHGEPFGDQRTVLTLDRYFATA